MWPRRRSVSRAVRMKPRIQIYRTDSEEMADSVSFGGELIYDLTFADEKTILAVGEQHARWYSTAGEQLGSYDYSDYYLKDFDFGGSGFLTLVLNMYQAGNRYQVTTVGAAGEALGSRILTSRSSIFPQRENMWRC